MKVLIVDDERHVRHAIRMLVHWEAYGVTEVIEAESGDQAIEVITAFSPPVVLTDMRMPGRDGVALMEWIQANSPATRVVVVSGYDDFELVRQAIRRGGMDYILKPVDPVEINEALSKATQAWRTAEQDRNRQTMQAMEVNRMRPHYADKLLTELISGTALSITPLREELRLPTAIQICNAAVMSTTQLDADILDKYKTRRALLGFSLINICNEFLGTSQTGIAFRHLERTDEIILLYWAEPARWPVLLQEIHTGIRTALRCYMHIGVGSFGTFPMGAATAYQEARQALWKRDMLQATDWIHESSPARQTVRLPQLSEMEEELRLSALSCNASRVSTAVGDWVAAVAVLPSVTAEQLAGWNQELDWMLARWLNDRPGDAEGEELTDESNSIPALPVDNRGVLSLPLWTKQIENRLLAAGQALTPSHSPNNPTIRDIARYLDAHYDKDISLQDIASRFYLSREYISRKFKQEYGVNLSDYLCQIRMSKAKLLLLNDKLRLHHIAGMVGYQDEKYFGKVFKKLEGVTPGEFRRRHSANPQPLSHITHDLPTHH
ncbi:response regulator [Paenibacillus polymyxa]|uniref:Nitrogen regulation protein NR(I) n=1 Tax=Paenibacillus polymyxa TaxID=1406 RepID=A0A378XQA2_PAEPO|nr:response regulator [Paenibacillus polymyxa]MBE7900581.1 response regulator [Paenibacillus polymyxa]MBG9764982.1 chemotaxis protein CheY [Paenibacillus polymyxa]MCC3260975.1 response regulator [Paenibacillus polymyxa]QPK52274.1 response regulator [Paenibacillus polymyxa]QPK57356.1 response regulator [Paenibacillus polymyxa]